MRVGTRGARVVAGLLGLALVVGGCAGDTGAPATAPPGDPTNAGAGPANGAAPPVGASRQTAAEAARTLASLRRVADLPLYEMVYTGDYDELTGVTGVTPRSPFGCSLFVASGGAGGPLFGRNFDWDPNPALVLRTDPPDGYASISMVDTSYLGVGSDPAGDRRLLDAPLLPFDGMNERGLAVGLAADEPGSTRGVGADPAAGPDRPTVGSVRILRLVLDQAATVDEAVAVFRRYAVDFTDGPPLHYLLADASGRSAVVEYVDGGLRILPGTPPWQVLTNIRLADVDESRRRLDRRYGRLASELTAAGGAVDPAAALGLLRSVAQPHTRWSVSYQLDTGEVRLVAGQDWTTIHEYRLPVTRSADG